MYDKKPIYNYYKLVTTFIKLQIYYTAFSYRKTQSLYKSIRSSIKEPKLQNCKMHINLTFKTDLDILIKAKIRNIKHEL